MRHLKYICFLFGSILVSFLNPCTSSADYAFKSDFRNSLNVVPHVSEIQPFPFLTINSGDSVIFDFSQAVCSGGIVQVPVLFLSDDPIYALDFAMKFNPSEFTYNSLISYQPYLNNSANYTLGDSTLRFSSFSMIPMDNNVPLVALRFNVPSGMISLSSFTSIQTWLNGDNCSFRSINIPVVPIQVPGGITSITSGDSMLLSISLPASHTNVWSNGSYATAIWVSNPGTYSVAVTNPAGCTAFSTIAISVLNPLPVELIDFSGIADQSGILLSWTTGSEVNNDHFVVQSSIDGLVWKSHIQIDGSGTTSEINQYEYYDSSPVNGRNYYRLKQCDFNGNCRFSEIIIVNNDLDNIKTSLLIYPNPLDENSNEIVLILPENANQGFVRISDIAGKEVYKKQIAIDCKKQDGCSLPVKLESCLEAGIYMVQFSGSYLTASKLLIIH